MNGTCRTLPAEVVARGVRFRDIYSPAALEIDGAREMLQRPVEAGRLCRVYPEPPMEMLWAAAVPVEGATAKLTPEQDQVLRLVLTGMTDAAIGRHPGISERTVRQHVSALREGLRASNQVALAATAVREGWVG